MDTPGRGPDLAVFILIKVFAQKIEQSSFGLQHRNQVQEKLLIAVKASFPFPRNVLFFRVFPGPGRNGPALLPFPAGTPDDQAQQQKPEEGDAGGGSHQHFFIQFRHNFGCQPGWRASTRLARDHYVRIDSNDYSIHPAVIGRRIELIVDVHRVRALCDGRLVADHERAWAWHQTITDPDHLAAAKALRRDRVGMLRPVANPADVQVEQRCLADYDIALGLDRGLDAGVDGGVA